MHRPASQSAVGRTSERKRITARSTLRNQGALGGRCRQRLSRHDLVLGEDVALKVLKRVHPHPAEAVEDLRNEVRLARRVTHRSIARVYDLVEHDGVYFLTMEFIDGISLAKRLGRRRSKQPFCRSMK